MNRLLALIVLVVALFNGTTAIAQTTPGCLAVLPDPVTWTLPNTPGTPNWTINSIGFGETSGIIPTPVAVAFSATFWRRSECASQLILTLNLPSAQMVLGSFSVFQDGQAEPFLDMIVDDPAIYGGNDLLLFGAGEYSISAISGVVDTGPDIDTSQAMTIDYTPLTPSGIAPVVQVQIPAAAASTPSPFSIGAGMTGSWYDPAQNGHGFSIEVLSSTTMLAAWYTFAPQGGQAWIVGTGSITGNTAVIQAYQAEGPGGMFPPNFNAAEVQEQPWGTITFTFTDCNNGTASWQPAAAGYISGSMPITRLTMPMGQTCP